MEHNQTHNAQVPGVSMKGRLLTHSDTVSDAWYNTAVGQLTRNYLLQTIWTLVSPH